MKFEQKTKIFSNNLDNLLNEKMMTAAELSRKTGISEASLCKYRKGTYLPHGETLNLLADALNVSVDYLLGKDGQGEYGIIKKSKTATAERPSEPELDYELNIIENLPKLSDEAKQLISVTIDALTHGNQNQVRVIRAYFDVLNRLPPSNAK